MNKGGWWATFPGATKELDTIWQLNNNNKMVLISSSSESPNFKREKKMREIEMHSNAVFHRNLEH